MVTSDGNRQETPQNFCHERRSAAGMSSRKSSKCTYCVCFCMRVRVLMWGMSQDDLMEERKGTFRRRGHMRLK